MDMMRRIYMLLFVICLNVLSLHGQQSPIWHMDEVLIDTNMHDNNTRFLGLLEKQDFVTRTFVINKGEALKRKSNSKTGLFFVALIAITLLALFRHYIGRHLNNLFDVLLKRQISKRQQIDQLSNHRQASWILRFGYFTTLAYVLFKIFQDDSLFQGKPSWIIYGYCFGITLGLYLLKYFCVKTLAWIFEQREAAAQYLFNQSIVSEFTSILLFPICIIMIIKGGTSDKILLPIAMGIILLSLAYRYVRGFGGVKKYTQNHFFHFLLYICAFEIIPFLVFLRIYK